MKTVGIREFRDQATTLMAGNETLIVERHGTPIGFFVPVAAVDRRAGRESLGALGAVVEQVLEQTGIDEDTLVREITGRRNHR